MDVFECCEDSCDNAVSNEMDRCGSCKGVEHGSSRQGGGKGTGVRYRKKRCNFAGCEKYAKKGGLCIAHGAKVKRCKLADCEKGAVQGGLCIAHGAKVKRCKLADCEKYAKKGGLCIAHGAKVKRCKFADCEKQAQKGGLCIAHGAKVKRCKLADCEKYARKGGLCMAHGAKVKKTKVDGGEKQAAIIGRRVTRASAKRQEPTNTVIRPKPVKLNVHPPIVESTIGNETTSEVKVKEEPIYAGVWELRGSLRREYSAK